MTAVLEVPDWLPTSPLTFIQPDVLTHVYELWVSGKHEDQTSRSFTAIFPIEQNQEFIAHGTGQVVDFLSHWKFSRSDIEFLRSLPSLNAFQEAFWDYLQSLRFVGSARGVRDGELLGQSPMQMSDELRRDYHYEGKSPWIIMQFEGSAASIALLSETVFYILAQSLDSSIIALRRKRNMEKPTHFYGASEQHFHPLFAVIEATLDVLLDNRPLRIFDQARDTIAIQWNMKDKDIASERMRELSARLRSHHNLSAIVLLVT
jgi:hypothetical protein